MVYLDEFLALKCPLYLLFSHFLWVSLPNQMGHIQALLLCNLVIQYALGRKHPSHPGCQFLNAVDLMEIQHYS